MATLYIVCTICTHSPPDQCGVQGEQGVSPREGHSIALSMPVPPSSLQGADPRRLPFYPYSLSLSRFFSHLVDDGGSSHADAPRVDARHFLWFLEETEEGQAEGEDVRTGGCEGERERGRTQASSVMA